MRRSWFGLVWFGLIPPDRRWRWLRVIQKIGALVVGSELCMGHEIEVSPSASS